MGWSCIHTQHSGLALDLQPVLNTFTRQAEATVIISYDGGSVEATTEHPFWVDDRGWVPAAQLQPGDALSGREGITYTVTALATRTGQQTVYNLEIAEFHTYHVAEGQLLVHNGCGIPAIRNIHGYDYHIDGAGRPVKVVAPKLTRDGSHKRNKQLSRDAGGIHRTAEDEGGHLIAHGLFGPEDEINIRAQRMEINRGKGSRWWRMERDLMYAEEAQPGSTSLEMFLEYPDGPNGTNPRPSRFIVDFWIDGEHKREIFDNTAVP